MLTSLNKLNKSIYAFTTTTFEEGVEDATELSSALWAMCHEDTKEFMIDYDLIKADLCS